MSGLIMHTADGKGGVTLKELETIPVPAATDTWNPVGHGNIAHMVMDAIGSNGLTIARESYGLAVPDKSNKSVYNRAFGVFDIANQDDEGNSVGFNIGWRNSIDKSFPAALCFGSRVFVCDNLCFSGEVTLKRRHTKNILRDLPAMILDAMAKFSLYRDFQNNVYAALREATINERDAAYLTVMGSRNGAFPKTRILDVLDEYASTQHADKHGHGTAWSLFNAGTEVAKDRQRRNLVTAASESVTWHRLFDREFAPDLALIGVDDPDTEVIVNAS